VLGEHGDTSFVAWSSATIAGVPIDQYVDSIASNRDIRAEYKREDIETYVKKSGGKIISRKGCTVYGIATTSMHIVKTLAGNAQTAMTVSSLHEGEYGLKDVCLSSLSLVGSDGVRSIITQPLSDDELKKLYESAEALKAVISGVEF
jgi:L-lactate dehydrogenase